jgi:hypothetical protein
MCDFEKSAIPVKKIEITGEDKTVISNLRCSFFIILNLNSIRCM